MAVVHDKVYLITSVAYPGHFLAIESNMYSKIIATTSQVNCWHLKHFTDTDEWVMNPISSPNKHQLIYNGTNTYSLKMLAEDKGDAFIASSEYKLKLTATDNVAFTGNYEISISKDGSTWLAAISDATSRRDGYYVKALSRDDTKPERQQWKFLKMPN